MQDFLDQYVKVLKNYTLFEGRATRSEFWKFILVSLIVSIALGMITNALQALYNLVVLIPSLAVGTRRLHDIGKSGWWQLLWFIPIVGWIILIVFFATNTVVGNSMHTANPTAATMPPASPAETPTSTPTPSA